MDLPASALHAKITVFDTSEAPTDGKVLIAVQFFSQGKIVQLASGATVACNGVTMPYNELLGNAERLPLVSTGGTYSCVHNRAGVSTTVTITVPPRPVFVSPVQGANVPRSSSLTITYVPGGGTEISGGGGDESSSQGGTTQADTGTYTGLNVSALTTGPGTLYLVRHFTFAPTGTGFQSVEVAYSSGSDISVTWQ